MVKKTEEKIALKPLKTKLLEAINRLLKTNKSILTDKMEKIVKKSVKRIAKRVKKQARNESKLK
jgi:hypothetical protein